MSPTNCWNLRVTAEVNQGGRRYMEDVTAVQFERAKAGNKVLEFASFAIFDGHGGKEAAHFARDFLLKNIKKNKAFFSNDVDSVKKAIREGFLATHQAMWNKLPQWPRTSNGHPSTAGTTASLVIIRGNKMFVANVGDSMVVMGSREHYERNNPHAFRTMELTVDHKPELEEEKRRIEHCGGCVMNKSGVNRVVWNRPKMSHNGPVRRSTRMDKIPFLAIARSLGDLWSFNSELNEFVVSPNPDVHMYDLHQHRDQFIILASDGLWNMVRPNECVTLVGGFEERKKKQVVTGTPAHMLVQLALSRWRNRNMRADNTSVIVVFIERKKMETTVKGRQTYSEVWTSARMENSGDAPVNTLRNDQDTEGPYIVGRDRFREIPEPPPSPAPEVEEPPEIVEPPVVAPAIDPVPAAEPEPALPPRSPEPEPLQDSSISSSSGDIIDPDELASTLGDDSIADNAVSGSTVPRSTRRTRSRARTMPATKRRKSDEAVSQSRAKRRKTNANSAEIRRRSAPVRSLRQSNRIKARNTPKK